MTPRIRRIRNEAKYSATRRRELESKPAFENPGSRADVRRLAVDIEKRGREQRKMGAAA